MDCLASHRDLSLYEFAKQKYESTPPHQIRPQPLLTGDDLIASGYQPGPQFKEMLAFAEDAQLEGKVNTKEEALVLVRDTYGNP
jgi:poly(A) polymerase